MARMEVSRDGNGVESRPSRASVGRLSLYLRRLEDLEREGSGTVSSVQLGDAVGVTDAQVRKDLAHIGSLGQPGIGYPTHELIAAIRRVLGLDREWSVAVVGIGNLSRALLRYRGFPQRGFRIVALFDTDASKVGQRLDGLPIHSLDQLPEVLADCKAELGLVAVPAEAAQKVANCAGRSRHPRIAQLRPGSASPARQREPGFSRPDRSAEQLAFLVQMIAD